MQASSSTSSEVNITVDPGDLLSEDDPSGMLLPSFGDAGGMQHQTHSLDTPPYLTAVSQLRHYSPSIPSPLRQHGHAFRGDYPHSHPQQPRLPPHFIRSMSSPQTPARPPNSFESLHILTQGIGASTNTATQLASAGGVHTGPHTPVHSVGPQGFSPASPLGDGFANSSEQQNQQQLLSPYAQGFSSLAYASHQTSPHSSSNSGSSTHTHSSPGHHPLSPLHGQHHLTHDDMTFQQQPHQQTEVLPQPQPQVQAQSTLLSHGHELQQVQQTATTMSAGESSSSRWDRLVGSVQQLQQYAQTYEFTSGAIDTLEAAINGLFSEAQLYQDAGGVSSHSTAAQPQPQHQHQTQQFIASPIDHTNMFNVATNTTTTTQAQANGFDSRFMHHTSFAQAGAAIGASGFSLDSPHGLTPTNS